MAVWMPVTVVPTSFATVAIDTFITDVSSIIRNWPAHSVRRTKPAAAVFRSAAVVVTPWPSCCRSPALSGGERSALQLIELGLVDRTRIQQSLGVRDLRRRAVGCRDRPDVIVDHRLLLAHVLGPPLGHLLVLRDQVDEGAEERQDDQEHHPGGLCPAADVRPAEDVGEDDDHHPDPDHPREEDDHAPEDVDKRVVGRNYHGSLLSTGPRSATRRRVMTG